jgi:hypothetical protein
MKKIVQFIKWFFSFFCRKKNIKSTQSEKSTIRFGIILSNRHKKKQLQAKKEATMPYLSIAFYSLCRAVKRKTILVYAKRK